MNYFQRLVKRFWPGQPLATPRRIAKERLEQVLVQDRIAVDPKYMAIIRRDLLKVLKKHFAVDEAGAEVYLISDGQEISFTANVPVHRFKRSRNKGVKDCFDMVSKDV